MLLQIIVIVGTLLSPVSVFYEAQSPVMTVGHDVGFDYDKFPMFNFSGSPEGFTLFDLSVIIFSNITFIVESMSLNGTASNDSMLITFTRFLGGEPYLSYYTHPSTLKNDTSVLDWSLPFGIEQAGNQVAIRVPEFELGVQISLQEGYVANLTVVTHWELQWIQRDEPIDVQAIAVVLFVISVIVMTAAYLLCTRSRDK